MAGNGCVIVGCTHGEEDSNRVLVAYLTAVAALDQRKLVVMWLTSEGVLSTSAISTRRTSSRAPNCRVPPS